LNPPHPLRISSHDPARSVRAGAIPLRLAAKALADRVIAAVLLAVLAPLILITMLLVRLTSAGSPLYMQNRTGRDGRTFRIYKLRTMHQDCERTSGIRWATRDDPRVTPLGRILRKTHLDELPQLWNVIRGDMSLVGPRPERPEIIRQIERTIPEYRERERILPGVTGLAQVQLPPDSDLDGVRRKLAHDLYYLENASLWLDLRIVVCTALKVVCVPSRLSASALGIPSVVADDAEPGRRFRAPGGRVEIQPA
jgi:lipopolysaccharide/colanic/teichoic acid biosynthesis glycosyltransferase